jgi:hypothetical protein
MLVLELHMQLLIGGWMLLTLVDIGLRLVSLFPVLLLLLQVVRLMQPMVDIELLLVAWWGL